MELRRKRSLGPGLVPCIVVGLSALLTAGCGGAEPETSAEAPEATAELDWVAGGQEDLGGLMLSSPPTHAAISERGQVAIVDEGTASVAILASEGTVVSQFGSRGAGPGQFDQPGQVGFDGDSLLWVADPGNQRITWFSPDGDVVRSVLAPLRLIPGEPWRAAARWPLEDGAFLTRVISIGATDPQGRRLPEPVVVQRADGGLHEVTRLPAGTPRSRRVRMRNGLYATSRQPLDGSPLVGAAPSGRWFYVLDRAPSTAASPAIHLSRYGVDGVLIDEVDIPYVPVPVSDEVRSRLRSQAEAMEAQLPAHLGITTEAVMEATWVPDYLPPVTDAVVDDTGFWLRREWSAVDARWERYDLSGTILSHVALPSNVTALAARPDVIVGWRVDSLQVARIESYRIRRPAPSERE